MLSLSKKGLLLAAILFLQAPSALFSAKPVEIIQVDPSKYNVNAKLRVTSPKVLKKKSPILLLVSNFPIGVDVKSSNLEETGVPINRQGSRILMAFSTGQRMYVTKDDVNLLVTQRSYFNKRFRIKVPSPIYNKIHDTDFVMYSMLVNCYGETIKNKNAYTVDVYSYVKEHSGLNKIKEALKKPYVLCNEPYGRVKKGSVLLDFFLKNANLSVNEYKLDVYIDGEKLFKLDSWTPYVLKNLTTGKHTIRLELIDSSGKIIKNSVSMNTATFYVE